MSNALQKLSSPGLFRLMLALIIILYHATGFGIGNAAVYMFFMISGFWISTMWIDKYSHTESPYLTFLVSRFWRVLPVFLIGSLMAWTILYFRGTIPNFPDSIFHQIFSGIFIFGYSALSWRPNGPSWSLDIECQFYLIAPLLIAFVTTRVKTLVVCAFVPAIATFLHGESTVAHTIVFFTIGAVSARNKWTPGPRLALAGLLATLSLIVACAFSPYCGILMKQWDLLGSLNKYNGGFCQILAIMMTPCAIYTTSQKGSRRDAMYGDFSFLLFMLHYSLIGALHIYDGNFLQRGIATAELLSITTILSLLVWKFVDRPMNKLRSQWVADRRIEKVEKTKKIDIRSAAVAR